jgi:hypothetical protein
MIELESSHSGSAGGGKASVNAMESVTKDQLAQALHRLASTRNDEEAWRNIFLGAWALESALPIVPFVGNSISPRTLPKRHSNGSSSTARSRSYKIPTLFYPTFGPSVGTWLVVPSRATLLLSTHPRKACYAVRLQNDKGRPFAAECLSLQLFFPLGRVNAYFKPLRPRY